VSKAIIDALEAVEVDQNQRHLMVVSRALGHRLP
jgi:hypothetical protein